MLSSALVQLHNDIARAMPQLIDNGPKSNLSNDERNMHLLTLGIPFLQMFQLQVRRLVYAGELYLCFYLVTPDASFLLGSSDALAQTPLVAGVKTKLRSGLANLAAQNRAGSCSVDGVSSKFQRLGNIKSNQPYLSKIHSAADLGGSSTLFADATALNEAEPS